MLHTHIVLQKRIHVSALLSASLLLVLSSLAFFPIASSYSSTLAAPAPSETTLSMTAESINLNLSVDNANGTFNASDPANLTVTTNNYTGYTLSLLASSNDVNATKLVNGENSISSISSVSSESDFNVGNWGIKPSKVNSVANNSYIPAPTATGTTLDTTNGANSNANSYTISLAAKADYTLPAGRYSNTFLLAATANPVGYTINYSAGTEDTVANMPTMQSGNLGETDVTISANIPTRAGYTFNNWCDDTINTTDGISTCTGTTYSPNDPFTTSMQTTNILNLTAIWNRTFILNFDANEGTGTMPSQTITGSSANINENTFTRDGYDFTGWNTLANGTGTAYASGAVYTVPATGTSDTLYAQWEADATNLIEIAMRNAGKTKALASDGKRYYQMQDMNGSICNAVTTPTAADYSDTPEARLVDNRDGKVYWVSKLKDGRCWMTQNLDHDIVTTSGFYTPNNTDIDINWDPVRGTIQPSGISDAGAVSDWADDYNTPYSVNPGNYYWSGAWYSSEDCPSTSGNNYAGCNYLAGGESGKFSTTAYTENGEHGQVGNYYNWSAATATNNTSSSSTDGTNVSTSICPKGWRLPIIKPDYEFTNLLNVYNANITSGAERDRAVSAKPLYFVRSGHVYSSALHLAGNQALYWSSTVNSSTQAYRMLFRADAIDSSYINLRRSGSSVRCVAYDSDELDTVNAAFAAAGKTTVNVDGEYYYKMQDMSDSICGIIRVGQEGRLVDVRDNKVYWILKAKDHHCWMTQNLDHDIVTTANFYTPDNTDINSNWTPSRGTNHVTNSLSDVANTQTAPVTTDPGDWYWLNDWHGSSSYNFLSNGENAYFKKTPFAGNGAHGHIGNWYNWPAAMASNTSTVAGNSNPNTSICPKGWRLPTSTSASANEWKTLLDQYGAYVGSGSERDRPLIAAPFYFVRDGYTYGTTLAGLGSGGYWTSTMGGSDGAYAINFSSSSVDVRTYNGMGDGKSVRCVAR